jgi:putative transposon-encoded protein
MGGLYGLPNPSFLLPTVFLVKEKRSSDVPFAMEEPPFTRKAKFEVYGEKVIEKEVKQSGNSRRVYLPPEWVGKHVKIIRIE